MMGAASSSTDKTDARLADDSQARALTVTALKRVRNAGTDLRADWFDAMDVNLSAAERRAATLTTRRTVKKQWQAAWLVRAIECIDLTTLAGDDTPGRVQRLCAKARHPLRDDLKAALGLSAYDLTTGAVCVYPAMVPYAVKALAGSKVPVASVATGFPAGLTPLPQRLAEIRQAVEDGADEIDIVINRRFALTGDWAALYEETRAMREACGPARMKAILATGDLKTLTMVYRASMVAMCAGSDFIKTSTGMEAANATLPVGLIMLRAIREYRALAGFDVAFKPAGGIRAAKDALAWLTLVKEEMGGDYMLPDMFRMGASGLLGDIERQIEHHVTGRYSSADRHGLA
jgi:deoxyribose-phosphate aldolase